jgi:catechol 2,3-dioxygenase-like lactoylglutathione lyase family enzyme
MLATMTIMAIDHILLAMPAGGENSAREFYAGVLGLTEMPKPAALVGRGGAWFGNGSVQIHLGVDPEFRPAKKAHPALIVRDIRGYVDRAQAQGCRIAHDEPLPGYERVFVYDPFGNRIELIEPSR